MKILVVDDERTFKSEAAYGHDIVYTETVNGAKFYLAHPNGWDEVWLDHDLGRDEDGHDLVKWIERLAYQGNLLDVGTFVIHSMNPIGRKRMAEGLRNFYNVRFVDPTVYMRTV